MICQHTIDRLISANGAELGEREVEAAVVKVVFLLRGEGHHVFGSTEERNLKEIIYKFSI